MHVADPGIDWKTRPYLYIADELIATEEQIQRLVDQGYQEVYVDLDKSAQLPVTPSLSSEKEISEPQSAAVGKPRVELAEELPKAVKVHGESISYAKRFMNDMRSGKVNMSEAAQHIEHLMDSLERNADALLSLSRLQQTDDYTYRHCVNVCILTTTFARYLGLDGKKTFASGLAGMFHDLGKALVPLDILNAPRKLSEAEFAVMKSHPVLGYEQLVTVPNILPEVLMGAMQHHEKHNGAGYPQGLAGDAISDIGRMVGVADIYDALTSKRAYKSSMHPHRALGIMFEMRDRDLRHEDIASFIRMLGVYPVGSVVEMEDGSRGVVSASNDVWPLKPMVTIVRDPDGKRIAGKKYDLAADGHAPAIVNCLSAETTDINPARVLGITPQPA
jgi:HD-GYP domain-containing protein (c-di-GMP phosphodiesterase class II)